VFGRLTGPPPLTPEVPDLISALDRLCCSDRPWLSFHLGQKQEDLSGRQAHQLSRGWGRALEAAGVGAGDRVLLLAPNGPEFVGAFFGAQRIGAVPVPVAWPFALAGTVAKTEAALKPLIEVARPRAVATTSVFAAASFGAGCPVVSAPLIGGSA
jgi:acyl-CoA synthetase (AMP-forming)/AMP-acid ligase II